MTTTPIPHSIEAERIVIGAMMLDPHVAKQYAHDLFTEIFWFKPHGIVFDVVRDMVIEKKPIEPPAVTMELHSRNLLETVGGMGFVTDLFCAVPTTATADHYRAELEGLHAKRCIMEAAHAALKQVADPSTCPHRLAEDMRNTYGNILALQAREAKGDLLPIAHYEPTYREFVEKVDERALQLRRWLPGLKQAGGTLVPGELMAIVADTGVGKTAVASSLAIAAAPLKVAYFQLELPANLAYPRFVQTVYGKSLSEVYQDHKQTKETWGSHKDLSHIWLSVKSGLSIANIRRRVEAMNAIADKPFDMVIVDYFQLLRGHGKTRYEKFSNEAEDAKIAAKETDSIWVLLSQVGRPSGEGETYEPGLHDAKESGSIENSSGLVLGVSRADDEHGEALKIRALKSTKGGAGTTVVANWNVQTLKITERYDGDIIP